MRAHKLNNKGQAMLEATGAAAVVVVIFAVALTLLALAFNFAQMDYQLHEYLLCRNSFHLEFVDCDQRLKRSLSSFPGFEKVTVLRFSKTRIHSAAEIQVKNVFLPTLNCRKDIALPLKMTPVAL